MDLFGVNEDSHFYILTEPSSAPFSQAESLVIDQNSPSSVDTSPQDGADNRSPRVKLSWPALYKTSARRAPKQLDLTDPQDIKTYIQTDLSLDRLNEIVGFLWFAGNAGETTSTLTEFVEQNLSIITTNRADMHVVTHFGKVYLKPLPDYLLCHEIWDNHICSDLLTYQAAYTMIFSYTNYLVLSKTDLRIAHAYGLVNENVSWEKWTSLVRDERRFASRNLLPIRWVFGELRLARLNWISRFRSLKMYHSQDSREWLVGTVVYIVLVLTAMQVGLGTTRLRNNVGFQRASFGFTVFSIVAPVIILFSRWTIAIMMAFKRTTNARVDPRAVNAVIKFSKRVKRDRQIPKNKENTRVENPSQV